MKKLITLLVFVSFLTAPIFAETVYVSSGAANIYKTTKKTTKVYRAKKGSRLVVLKRKGSLINVRVRNKKGWIKSIFTSKKKPGRKVSLLGRAGNNARIHARKRASSDTTAASARGLVADRSNLRNKQIRSYDVGTVLTGMEQIFVSEEAINAFMEEIKDE